MPTNINFVEKLDAGCDTQVSFNLPKTLSLGTVKKSLDNNGLSEAEGCSYLALNRLNETALLGKASLVINPSSFSENAVYADVPANSTLGDLVFTRATDAWRTNSQGLIQRVAWNLVQQSQTFNNAAWSKSRTSVLPNTAISPNGDLTATTLIEDTSNATHRVFQSISKSNTPIQYTFSCYLKAKERTFAQIRIAENGELDSASAVINLSTGQLIGTYGTYSNRSASVVSLNNDWYRLSITATSVNASSIVAFIFPALNGNLSSPGYLGDGTSGIYIWGAQLVEGASPLEYFTTTDRQDVPRIDYSLGGCPNILLEPQRTNSIRNNTMVGASTSPSTLPTNWARQNTSGLTQTIVGVGTENGLNYIDINLQGTAVGTNDAYSFDQTISASIGQTWTNSWYFKLISSTPNLVRLAIQEFNGGSFLNVVTQDITPTANLERYAQTKTLVGVGVTNVRAMIYINFVIGQTYNTTIRIAQPQMELGAYATTIIPTTSASVTRNADVINRTNVFTNNLITASGGTWFVDLRNNLVFTRDSSGSGVYLTDITGGLFGFRIKTFGTARLFIGKVVGGTETGIYTTLTNTVKIAIKWNGVTADVFVNGVKVVAATAFTDTAMQLLASNVSVPLNINSMMLFPTPLSDAECIQLTTL
jgi:hypothetical protein